MIAERAVPIFGADVVGVLLDGSWARGEATAASGVDALVVLEAALDGLAVPRVHDVAPILHAERAHLPEALAPHLAELPSTP